MLWHLDPMQAVEGGETRKLTAWRCYLTSTTVDQHLQLCKQQNVPLVPISTLRRCLHHNFLLAGYGSRETSATVAAARPNEAFLTGKTITWLTLGRLSAPTESSRLAPWRWRSPVELTWPSPAHAIVPR